MTAPLRDVDLQRMYSMVLALWPSVAKLFNATSSATAYTSTSGLKQDEFKTIIEYAGTQRWFDETIEEYVPIQIWKASVPKYVNPSGPTVANDYSTADQFWALGYIFRVESVEVPESYQLEVKVNLRWSGATSETEYGTYSFAGEAPFDTLQDQAENDITTEAGKTIFL